MECQLFIINFAYHFGNHCEELCVAQRLWACYTMEFEGGGLNSLYQTILDICKHSFSCMAS